MTHESEDFVLPSGVLDNHVAVLGKTGSGKTSTAKLIIEHVVAQGFRVCVLDTVKSDWWGLTSSRNGKSAGLDFKILGGPRGHVPLHSNAGKVIGQLVGSAKLRHAIIDMADFEAGGIQKFFVDFAQALMRNMKGVLYLVIEEAHEVAPKERAGFGSENMAIHWAKKLATAGRSKGIRLIVATQSVQQLHNRVLGSAETLIAHRLTAPADQEPVVKWLKANTDKDTALKIAGEMSSVPTGTAWVCSGEVRFFDKVKFPKFATYDNTSTPTGDIAEKEIKTAPVDQDELKTIIGAAVEEALANDPAVLKKEISRLTRDLKAEQSKTPVAGPAPEPQQIVVVRDEDMDTVREAIAICERTVGSIQVQLKPISDVRNELEALRVRMAGFKPGVPISRITAGVAPTANRPKSVERRTEPRPVHVDGASLGKCERSILSTLAKHDDGCSIGKLALLSGYTQSGSFKNCLSALRTAGLIEGDNTSTMRITDEGQNHGPFDPLPNDLAVYWLSFPHFGKCERAILGALIENPDGLTLDALCDATRYEKPASGSFKNCLSALRTAGVVVGRNSDTMRASDDFFQ